MARPKKEEKKKKKPVEKTEKYEMPKEHLKGIARRRGKPIMYDEVKKSWNIKITPTAKNLITEESKRLDLSPSELIERLVRKELVENDSTTKEEEEILQPPLDSI